MRKLKEKDIKKGRRFYWQSLSDRFCGWYEIVCYQKNKFEMLIFAYKPLGEEATINRGVG